jgi:hypothetical protein
MTNLLLLGISKLPVQAYQLLPVANYTPHVIRVCQKVAKPQGIKKFLMAKPVKNLKKNMWCPLFIGLDW